MSVSLRAEMLRFEIESSKIEGKPKRYDRKLKSPTVIKETEYINSLIYDNLDVIKLGERERFSTVNNFRTKDDRDDIDYAYVIGFTVITDSDEDENKYTILMSKDGKNEWKQLESEKTEDNVTWYFDRPKLKSDEVNMFSQDENEITVGYSIAGSFYIGVKDENFPKIVAKYPVTVFPSSINFIQYRSMVNDLLRFKEILKNNFKGKQIETFVCGFSLENLELILPSLILKLKHIVKNPKCILSAGSDVTKLHRGQIKKYNGKFWQDYVSDPHREKFRAVLLNETNDIYENRVIKYSLNKIIKKINSTFLNTCDVNDSKDTVSVYNENDMLKKKVEKLRDNVSTLEKLLDSKFFKDITGISGLHLTQLFINNPDYHRIYLVIKKLDELYKCEDSYEYIISSKVDKLFEIWVYIKFIEYLLKKEWIVIKVLKQEKNKDIIKEQWQIVSTDVENVINALGDNESGLDFFKQISFVLKKGNMICEIKHEWKIKPIDGSINPLDPDYIVEIYKEEHTEQFEKHYIFVLDAKYRDYSQVYFCNVFDDLAKISINKYLQKLKPCASFIVHSYSAQNEACDDLQNEFCYWGETFDPRIYSNVLKHLVKAKIEKFNKFADKDMSVKDKEKALKYAYDMHQYNASIAYFTECLYDERCVQQKYTESVDSREEQIQRDYQEFLKYKYGAFYMLPYDYEENLKFFFEKVVKHHCEYFQL